MVNARVARGTTVATHVAMIMDGNGRWAVQRGMPRLAGHKRGVERVRDMVQMSPKIGVTHLTLFAFSTENWKRASSEVQGLMRLFRWYIKRESAKLIAEGVRVRFIGNRHRLDPDLRRQMDWLEEATAEGEALNVTVAIDYGARDEIARAAAKIATRVAEGTLSTDEIDEDVIGAHMDTAGMPDPDLVIRTSGEVRISNFLLWQAAYAEYDFVDVCWPDFTPERYAACVADFCKRERRFGAVMG